MAGKIIWKNPNLISGGQVRKGEILDFDTNHTKDNILHMITNYRFENIMKTSNPHYQFRKQYFLKKYVFFKF